MGIRANNFESMEINMKIKSTTGLLALAFALGSAALAVTATSHQAKERSSAVVTVAGCLQNGTTTDVFLLTAKDGKGWDVSSKTVDIAKHVGHTVSLTGTPVTTASTDGSAASATTRLDVSDLKMVSETCSR
jgi:ABC-type sugar transport system substrate-binding protein